MADEGPEEASRPLLGRLVAGKFLIESFLGGGGMGAVFRARWVELDQVVAIKVIRPELAGQAGFAARFKREAKAASRLDHPNSVRIIDFGVDGDVHYMVMEYVDGTHLLAELEDGWPISDERIVDILGQVLAALAKAHELGIVHRDLKPENIMVSTQLDDEGRPGVKVCDFGIAKVMSSDAGQTSALTSNGLILGTPEYMSPEQGMGEAIDARADIYSVGVILYQILTRTLPFSSETPLGLVYKHVSVPLIPPIEVRPEINPAFDVIVRRAMAKKPDDRFPSAREMRRALRAAIGIEAAVSAVGPVHVGPKPEGSIIELATARTEAAVVRPVKAANRSVAPLVGAAAMLVLAVIGIGLALHFTQKPAVAASGDRGVSTADLPAPSTDATKLDAAVATAKAEPSVDPVGHHDVVPVPSASTAIAKTPADGTHKSTAKGVTKPAASAPPPVVVVDAPPPSATPAPPASNKKPTIEANPFN